MNEEARYFIYLGWYPKRGWMVVDEMGTDGRVDVDELGRERTRMVCSPLVPTVTEGSA